MDLISYQIFFSVPPHFGPMYFLLHWLRMGHVTCFGQWTVNKQDWNRDMVWYMPKLRTFIMRKKHALGTHWYKKAEKNVAQPQTQPAAKSSHSPSWSCPPEPNLS